MGKILRNGIEFSSTSDTANNINYDNSKSGLDAVTVQEAVDEVTDSLSRLGEVELLASTTSTTESTHTIKDISNYKWLYLVRTQSTGNPCLCPVSLFRETKIMATQLYVAGESNAYGGQVNYVSDTSIKMKVVQAGTVRLYGIK